MSLEQALGLESLQFPQTCKGVMVTGADENHGDMRTIDMIDVEAADGLLFSR